LKEIQASHGKRGKETDFSAIKMIKKTPTTFSCCKADLENLTKSFLVGLLTALTASVITGSV